MRFLDYWDEFDYTKYTTYSSSIRLELIVKRIQGFDPDFYIQFIYDD